MSTAENYYFILGFTFLFIGFLMILNAIYFQIRYQKKTDQALHGDNYIDGGWIFNASRMMMYAHYCLFPKRAARAGILEQVRNLPKVIKVHLIFHWAAVILGSLALAVGSSIGHFILKL